MSLSFAPNSERGLRPIRNNESQSNLEEEEEEKLLLLSSVHLTVYKKQNYMYTRLEDKNYGNACTMKCFLMHPIME